MKNKKVEATKNINQESDKESKLRQKVKKKLNVSNRVEDHLKLIIQIIYILYYYT